MSNIHNWTPEQRREKQIAKLGEVWERATARG